jgi:diacylglycerol kinase (ATP)
VANTYRMGQGLPIAPGAQITDGELDIVVMGPLQRSELLAYYRAVRAQLHATMPRVTMLRGRDIRIQSRHRMNVHCDDSVVGTTPVQITVQAQALKVLVGRL